MKKLWLCLCFASSLLVLSCNSSKEELTPGVNTPTDASLGLRVGDESLLTDEKITGDYEVRKGVIHFKNLEAYTKLMKENETFLRDLKQNYSNFISFKQVALNALTEVESANSQEAIINLVSKNKDFIYEKDKTALEKMPGFIAEIINPSGFMVIGRVYYRYTPESQYIILGDNQKWLDDAKAGKSDGKNVVKINVKNNARNGKIAVWGCTWLGGVQNDVTGYKRVEANLWVDSQYYYTGQSDPVTGEQIYQIDLWVTTVGISRKRNSVNSNWWSRYRANHSLRTNWEVKASLNGVLKVQQSEDTQRNDCYNCDEIRADTYIVGNYRSGANATLTRSVYTLSNFLSSTNDVPIGAKPTDCWGNGN